MAYRKPRTMDEFAKLCVKGDTRQRQNVGADLVAYLADTDNAIECEDIGAFIDALVQWMQGSNFKVTQNALEALTHICDRLNQDFWPYVQTILPHVIDRLGDQKETVRERAQILILKLLEKHVIQPQQLCDKLSDGFTHKNAKIREEVMRCVVNILNEHGPQHITVSKITPCIAKLVSDPIPSVRDTALNTFVEIYKHVGEKLSQDIQKKNCIPAGKLPTLLQKFSDVKRNGELLPSAVTVGNDLDEPDRVLLKPTKPVKRTISAPAVKRTPAMTTPGQAGAVDEASFLSSFEDVPSLLAISSRDVSATALKDIKDIVGDKDMLWTKRVENLKKLRSLLLAGAAQYEDFIQNMRTLAQSLAVAATDGRSQVSREACVTIAYLSQELGHKFDKTAAVLLPYLIGLIQNSAKVIATAGTLSLRHVLTYTQYGPLIPIVASHATVNKSKEIRRACCDFISHIIRTWPPTPAIEKQVPILSEAIKKGIADADNDARQISRKSFWAFKETYPDAADALLKSLEPTYRRTLLASAGSGDHMSSSSSSSSLNQAPTSSQHHMVPRSTASSQAGSTENLHHPPTLTRAPSLPRSYRQRSGIPVLNRDNSVVRNGYNTPRAGMRSYTAIDLQAAQRAKARTQYAAMARQKIASGTASLHGEVAQEARPKKTPKNIPTPSSERAARTRSRPLGGSISQPTSRSVSPSLRISYATYGRFNPADSDVSSPRPRKLSSSGVPRSTSVSRDQSREASPTRGSRGAHLGYSSLSFRGSSGPGSLRSTPSRDHRPPISPHRPPVMAQKILQQSREAETALAAALQTTEPMDTSEYMKSVGGRKLTRSVDNPSDDSEASSVCSERSYDSFRRPSDVSTPKITQHRKCTTHNDSSTNILNSNITNNSRGRLSSSVDNIVSNTWKMRDCVSYDSINNKQGETVTDNLNKWKAKDRAGNYLGVTQRLDSINSRCFRNDGGHVDNEAATAGQRTWSVEYVTRPKRAASRLSASFDSIVSNQHWTGLQESERNQTNDHSSPGRTNNLSVSELVRLYRDVDRAKKNSGDSEKSSRFLDASNLSDTSANSICDSMLRSPKSDFPSSPGLNRSYSLSGSHTRLSRDHWDGIAKDINEIIKLCASVTWTERKEGLIGLYSYFTDGNVLMSSQLKKVTEIFPKLFMDSNTKVVSLFLDTLNELLLTHHNDLHDWLYMLLQRIFNKLGGELLGSIYKKIEKTLDVIRENFPVELQMNSVFRYLTDHTQRPNSKVKVTILIYLIHLSNAPTSIVFDNKTLISQGLEKIIMFTEDKKSTEVQNVAKNCLISLLNNNTPQLMMMFASLPPDRQEVAYEIIQSLNLRKASTGSQSPSSHEGFTREDIHRSLRNTTAEIQNYSFDTSGGQGTIRLERDSTSQDSGISQMSTGGGGARNNNNGGPHVGCNAAGLSLVTDDLVDGMRGLQLNNIVSPRQPSGPLSLPNTRFMAGAEDNIATNGADDALSDEELMRRISEFETREDVSNNDKKLAFTQLAAAIKNGHIVSVIENFRVLLRVLLNHLCETGNDAIASVVLEVFTEIFNSEEMTNHYLGFVELLTLKILKAHGSPNREVIRHAERAAAAMTKCPLPVMAQVINPLIRTSEDNSLVIEGGLKFLTRMIEANGATQLNTELLNLIVPNLLKAYDHPESPVRKCAVFCMVAIHKAVGEEAMKPHLVKLSGSKMKLLHLYIQRAQNQGSSVPTSPKNTCRSSATS